MLEASPFLRISPLTADTQILVGERCIQSLRTGLDFGISDERVGFRVQDVIVKRQEIWVALQEEVVSEPVRPRSIFSHTRMSDLLEGLGKHETLHVVGMIILCSSNIVNA